MPKIKLLDDNTIDKIAAGEVIERPSSVIKELVENSIDSGATSITVEIKNGGISYIRVTDNGCGIEKSDIRTAFMRHATSKISDVMDLFRISSLGFRGEALSSICAISSVEVLTKTVNDFSGIRYVISGQKEETFEDAGVPNGTTIIVKNLFYNTPARRKFLKSPNTEASHITDLMECMILSHPEISFKYVINGIDRLVSVGNSDVLSTIYSVYGRDCAKGMIPVEFECDLIKISGYIGKPELCRGNRNFELFFVNNRYVKSKVISASVEAAYKHRLMLHKYPFVVLYLFVDPQKIDINVHPAKTEIKFMDEIAISTYIASEIDRILAGKELIPSVSNDLMFNNEGLKATPEQTIIREQNKPVIIISNEPSIKESNEPQKAAGEAFVHKPTTVTLPINSPEPFETKREEEYKENFSKSSELILADIKQSSFIEESFISAAAVKKHKIIGQLFETYWLVEFNDSLYIIDQHAAHEKVLYERYMERYKTNAVSTQIISPPEIMSLSSQEEETLKKYSQNLSALGFEWEHFGGHEYSLCGVPIDLYGLTSRDYFLTVLDDLAEGKRQTAASINDRIATMACKAAVKGNMNLSVSEAKALIDELLELENPYNCPHGRPCIISYSKEELEKLFKRIV